MALYRTKGRTYVGWPLAGVLALFSSMAVGETVAPAVLEEVRVIGARDLRNTEDTVFSIESDDQVSMSRSVADWLERVPGVSLNGQGGLLQAYSVRGFSRARVRTDIDGVPIITDRRAGNSASFLPTDLVSRIEVENGPASSLYGSGALGGVVKVSTLEPDGRAARARLRSNDDLASLTISGGTPGAFGAGLSVRRAANAEAGNGDEINTEFQQVAAILRGATVWNDIEIDYRWLPSLGRDIGRSNALYPGARISTTPDERHSVARVEARSSDDWLLRLYHHFQDWDTDVLRVGSRRNITSYQAHTLGGLFHQRSVGLGDGGSWGVEWIGRRGVEIRERETSAEGVMEPLQVVVDGDEDTLGVFLDQEWGRDGVSLTGTVRGDYVHQAAAGASDNDLRASGSLVLSMDLNEAWDASVEVASGFRFPSLSERYFNGTTPRGVIQGNRDLNPELRTGIEFGLSYTPMGGPLRLEGNVYYSDLQDYIERFAVDDGLLSFRNLDEAFIRGFDLVLGAELGSFAHTLSYQWQEGEDAQDRTLADLNPPGWRYFLGWQNGPYELRSDVLWRPSRNDYGAGEMALDSALVWNLGLAWESSPGVLWELQLNNMSDETYRGSADDLAPWQPGRAVALAFSWQG